MNSAGRGQLIQTPASSSALAPLTVGVPYDLSTRGAMVHADLEGRSAAVIVGESDARVEIEVSPTGPLAGDYFVGTFEGAHAPHSCN